MKTNNHYRTIVGYFDQPKGNQFTYQKAGVGASWKITAN